MKLLTKIAAPAIALLIALPSQAVDIKLETDADIMSGITPEQIHELVVRVRRAGYSCNSVSLAGVNYGKDVWRLGCNEWRYFYKVTNRGGRFLVEVAD